MICKIFVNDSKCSLSFFKETYAPADLRNCKQAVGTGISTATGFSSRDWIKEMVLKVNHMLQLLRVISRKAIDSQVIILAIKRMLMLGATLAFSSKFDKTGNIRSDQYQCSKKYLLSYFECCSQYTNMFRSYYL